MTRRVEVIHRLRWKKGRGKETGEGKGSEGKHCDLCMMYRILYIEEVDDDDDDDDDDDNDDIDIDIDIS